MGKARVHEVERAFLRCAVTRPHVVEIGRVAPGGAGTTLVVWQRVDDGLVTDFNISTVG
jgi:hypothetical protein